MATFLQINVGRGTEALHCALETAKERGIDLVLMQETPQRDDPSFRPQHPGFTLIWTSGRTCAAKRIDSPWTFSLEEGNTRETEGDAQVITMKRRGSSKISCRIINTYVRMSGILKLIHVC